MNCPNGTPIVGNLQTIAINRGTLLKLKAQRIDVDGEPILTRAQGVYFIIKRQWRDENALIKKDLTGGITYTNDGYYHITIDPEDTENLPYGKYVWDFTATEDSDAYRAKPAKGYFIIGNSAGWIINEEDE